MQLGTAEELIAALGTSGLFSEEQFAGVKRELESVGSDLRAVLQFLHDKKNLTYYQLKKLLHGKGPELVVGPYIITDRLGDGGMGKVYRAYHVDRPRETIALKVVRATLVANPVVRGRYAREVQTSGTLAHPNIVRLFDAGEAHGKFYLAMEFVDGIDLARMMREFGRLEVVEACEYIRQAALGLEHAHQKGFVHRDVKPSNIVVAGERHLPQAREPAVVKLLDMGLARAMDPDDMVLPDLTRDHTVVGTPDYMAPEQAKNSRGADPRCDLYSLGCTLYFLLAGRVPFPHATAIQKILAHQSEIPPPIQSLRPDVPAAVAQLITALMAKNPDQRLQTAAEVAARLAPFCRYAPHTPPVKITVLRDDTSRDTRRYGSTASENAPFAPPAPAAPSPLQPVFRGWDDDAQKTDAAKSASAPQAASPSPSAANRSSKAPSASRKPSSSRSREPNSRPAPPSPTPRPQRLLMWGGLSVGAIGVVAFLMWLVLR
ncbi:MAG: serine/threonine-protein kinase [Gemmataceae bacterium]|nr:serine/threonine protein kinase [Gemmata sp.]MDW8196615.1 serine/threonine-protein kinase [Gemmataceae bacterium]